MASHSVILIQQVASLFRVSRVLAKRERQKGKTGLEKVNSPAPSRIERAPRFSAPQAVWYRPHGGLDWIEGKILNISRSGVLFQVDFPLRPNSLVEMNLTLPVDITGEIEINIVCWAKVVRSITHDSHEIAAKMMHGRLGRP